MSTPPAKRMTASAANYKYVLELGEYIASEERKLRMGSEDQEERAEFARAFDIYEKTRDKLPDYFFRTPQTTLQCHTSMMDAIDVMYEDRHMLIEWNKVCEATIRKLEGEVSELEQQPFSEAN